MIVNVVNNRVEAIFRKHSEDLKVHTAPFTSERAAYIYRNILIKRYLIEDVTDYLIEIRSDCSCDRHNQQDEVKKLLDEFYKRERGAKYVATNILYNQNILFSMLPDPDQYPRTYTYKKKHLMHVLNDAKEALKVLNEKQ